MNQHDEKFISELKSNLEKDEDNIDAHTKSSLNQARNSALKELDNSIHNSWRSPMFAAAFASVLLSLSVCFTVYFSGGIQEKNEFILDEVEYAAFIESSDFLVDNLEEEIEFYAWLDEQEPS